VVRISTEVRCGLRVSAYGIRLLGIEASDVLVGLMVRKGLGGTCPARSTARKLQAQGGLFKHCYGS
jgi:hypothetical protein